MSTRIPLVLFSGGADSAALLQMRLDYGPCDILILDASVHPLKVKAEEVARGNIIRYLEDKKPSGRIRDMIDLRKDFVPVLNNAWAGKQPPIWMMGALSAVDPDRHSMVDVGYVLGDDVQGQLDSYVTFWDAAIRAFFCMHWDRERGRLDPLDLPLCFPFRFVRKHGKNGIYDRLGSELFHLTWSCEMPVEKDGVISECESCIPCKTRARAMQEMGWPYDRLKEPVETKQLSNPPLVESVESIVKRQARKKKPAVKPPVRPKKTAKRAPPVLPPRMKGAKKATKKKR